jgi:hypothetical protein
MSLPEIESLATLKHVARAAAGAVPVERVGHVRIGTGVCRRRPLAAPPHEKYCYSWLKRRYKALCSYTHGGPGARNMDFWQSNGPIYVPQAFPVVQAELRETLALAYLLLKVGWSGYVPREGAAARLLSGPATGGRSTNSF